ncbi:trypsin-like serine peptidase [Nocardioides sp. BYT-33-1]|uniref:trypsin-like serine peptidase n=1 Tax=Nocardioides sp. BYT-33-1 TaxID=3416952 RepID=UPI003F52F0DA
MRRSLGALVVAALVAASALTAPTAPAAGSDRGPGPAPRPARAAPPLVHALSPHAVRRFWTPRRMREAVPLDLGRAGERLPAPVTDPAGRRRAADPSPRSAGKLFFSQGASTYVCSAAAVNTPERNLVVTAGHCVNTGGVPGYLGGCRAGSYFTNFLFVPAYDQRAAPYGSWVGTHAVAPAEWIQQCNAFSHDQAMIAVAPLNGRNLVDVVGGNGLAWNYPAREDGVRIVGWPAESPYDGQTRHECGGSSAPMPTGPDAQVACPMTQGSSGGPWFLRMASADTGFVWAVTSRLIEGRSVLLATPFDSSIETLLAAARTAGRPVAARAVVARPKKGRKQRVRLAVTPTSVGFGETYQLVVSTRRVRKVVLQTRTSPGEPWQRTATLRTRGGGAVVTEAGPPGTRWYRVKVKKGRKRSAPVAVTVLPCPLPLDRSPAVVAATRCTSPVG